MGRPTNHNKQTQYWKANIGPASTHKEWLKVTSKHWGSPKGLKVSERSLEGWNSTDSSESSGHLVWGSYWHTHPLSKIKCAIWGFTLLIFWLCMFVMKAHKKDHKPYPPDIVHCICCGLFRALQECSWGGVKPFENPECVEFTNTLDARMKECKSTGEYQNKRAGTCIITEPEEIQTHSSC